MLVTYRQLWSADMSRPAFCSAVVKQPCLRLSNLHGLITVVSLLFSLHGHAHRLLVVVSLSGWWLCRCLAGGCAVVWLAVRAVL